MSPLRSGDIRIWFFKGRDIICGDHMSYPFFNCNTHMTCQPRNHALRMILLQIWYHIADIIAWRNWTAHMTFWYHISCAAYDFSHDLIATEILHMISWHVIASYHESDAIAIGPRYCSMQYTHNAVNGTPTFALRWT